MTATARLRLILAAAGIVPTAACGATSTRLKTTDTTAVVTPETTTTSAGAAASAPADATTTTTEAPVTVTIAAPAEAPAVPVFVMPEAETPESDASWWARQPGYGAPDVLACIRSYESGDDYGAVSPGGQYRGGYQFDLQTWQSVGGSGDPASASPAEQDARALALYESRGLAPVADAGEAVLMTHHPDNQERGDMADKTEKAITPFVEWLATYKKGETDGELTHELRTLIEAVQDTGKAGQITLTLRVNRKSDNQVTIIEDIKVTVPQHSRSEAIYFLDQHLNLTRSDPRQGVLTPMHGRASGGEGE